MCGISEFEENEKNMFFFFKNACNSSLTYTTYKPSHRSHTIIPLSNHHTITILKSIELRNIYFETVIEDTCTRVITKLSIFPVFLCIFQLSSTKPPKLGKNGLQPPIKYGVIVHGTHSFSYASSYII